jgi:hypothetical protein
MSTLPLEHTAKQAELTWLYQWNWNFCSCKTADAVSQILTQTYVNQWVVLPIPWRKFEYGKSQNWQESWQVLCPSPEFNWEGMNSSYKLTNYLKVPGSQPRDPESRMAPCSPKTGIQWFAMRYEGIPIKTQAIRKSFLKEKVFLREWTN